MTNLNAIGMPNSKPLPSQQRRRADFRRMSARPSVPWQPRRRGEDLEGRVEPAFPRRLDRLDVLLPDTKSAEDAVEHVFGVDGADDLSELIERDAQFGRDKLFARRKPREFFGAVETLGGQS